MKNTWYVAKRENNIIIYVFSHLNKDLNYCKLIRIQYMALILLCEGMYILYTQSCLIIFTFNSVSSDITN